MWSVPAQASALTFAITSSQTQGTLTSTSNTVVQWYAVQASAAVAAQTVFPAQTVSSSIFTQDVVTQVFSTQTSYTGVYTSFELVVEPASRVVRPRSNRYHWHRRQAMQARELAAQQQRDYRERLNRIRLKQETRKAQREAWLAAERQRIAYEQQRQREAEIRRENERRALEQLERQRAVTEANAKAHALLLSFLTPAQRAEYELARQFEVIGQSGTRYRIRYGRSGNIEQLDQAGTVVQRYCVHPSDYALPPEDVMLAQALHLRANDNELTRIANRV